MTRMLSDRIARFVAATAALGSLTDWTLFAGLVVAVDRATDGSPWATSLVLAAKIVPAIVFAPIAARRVDGQPLRRTLVLHEVGRVAATVAVGLAALDGNVPAALVALIAFEYAAAMQAATREALISRHVDATHFTALNTVTAVLGYGLLPVGALLAALAGPHGTVAVTVTGYLLVALAYTRLRIGATDTREAPASTQPRDRDAATSAPRQPWPLELRRAVAAAALGVVPPVMLFTIAPRLAQTWTGSASNTGALLVPVFVGAGIGFVAANRGRAPAMGLIAAAVGLGVAAAGLWHVGLVGVGFGAGLAYLGLQTQLQHLADQPSQFAAAFAALKAATIAATLAGPAVYGVAGATTTLQAAAIVTAIAAAMLVGVRAPLRALIRGVVLLAVRIEVHGVRHDGPAVVVSNHPNAVDGVVALAIDPILRPIARWQRNPLARAGIWIGDAVVTTAGTERGHRPAYLQAADHLAAGGRIWLAPEGGAHAGAELRPPRSGAVRMAHAGGVPIQALGIVHEHPAGPRLRDWRPWHRPRVVLTWGAVERTCGILTLDNDRMMNAIADASGTRWDPSHAVAA